MGKFLISFFMIRKTALLGSVHLLTITLIPALSPVAPASNNFRYAGNYVRLNLRRHLSSLAFNLRLHVSPQLPQRSEIKHRTVGGKTIEMLQHFFQSATVPFRFYQKMAFHLIGNYSMVIYLLTLVFH